MKKETLLLMTGLVLMFCTATAQNSWNTTLIGHWGYGPCWTAAIDGSYAFIGSGCMLIVLDVNNPNAPVKAGELIMPDIIRDIVYLDGYLFIACCESGLRIVNIANPSSPFEAGYYDTPGYALDVAVSGNLAYVADFSSGLRIINIADPSSPFEAGYYDTPGDAWDVAVSGNFAYVADFYSGLRIINIAT